MLIIIFSRKAVPHHHRIIRALQPWIAGCMAIQSRSRQFLSSSYDGKIRASEIRSPCRAPEAPAPSAANVRQQVWVAANMPTDPTPSSERHERIPIPRCWLVEEFDTWQGSCLQCSNASSTRAPTTKVTRFSRRVERHKNVARLTRMEFTVPFVWYQIFIPLGDVGATQQYETLFHNSFCYTHREDGEACHCRHLLDPFVHRQTPKATK